METLILVLVALIVLTGSVAGFLAFRARAQGLRLLIVAPVPAAVVVGILGAAYLVSYASSHGAIAFFACLLVFGTWLAGFVLCSIGVLFAKWF
jgi:hypothetical protein